MKDKPLATHLRTSLKDICVLRIARTTTVLTALIVTTILTPTLSAEQFILNWTDNSNNESGFKIECSADSAPYTQIAAVGANTTYYIDTNVVSGKAYQYRVRAYNAYGNSNFSNVAEATIDPSPQPNNPPTISNITDQAVDQGNSTGALGFTIGDTETTANNLTVTGSSSNSTLVPQSGIIFGGSGNDRTVTITPVIDLSGTATITITVNDGTTSTSDTFLLTVNEAPQAAPKGKKKLSATSIRAHVRKGDSTMIAGFVISGTGSKQILIRAAGPSLEAYGVTDTVDDPYITLYRKQKVIAENDNWGTAEDPSLITLTTELVGAFPFPGGSKDAALLLDLPVGAYTAHITDVNGDTGAAVVEMYDADDAFELISTTNLASISMRGEVSNGSDVVIAGFVVTGSEPKRLLIRAVGSELADSGVSGALDDSILKLYQAIDGETFQIAYNDDWGTDASQITTVSDEIGISSLDNGSKSAAMVIWLDPGVYTAHAASSDASKGVALVEVYEAL
jgi:hypothetical protein